MKKIDSHKIRVGALLLLLPLIVVACFEFEQIIQPGSALTDSEIEVTAQMKITPGTDDTGRLVFGVLAPKAWNLREKASLYLTTKDLMDGQNIPDVINEPLEAMPDSEKDPKNGLSWSESFMQVIGRGNNDPQLEMEWTVWRSKSSYHIYDKIKDEEGNETKLPPVHADVKIKLRTGIDPVTCELGYSYCYDKHGLKRDDQRFAEAFRAIETYDKIFTLAPDVFRYGDVFGIVFAHRGTALRDTQEIYLCGTATHDGGQKTSVTAAGAKNAMVSTGSRFEKWLYARDFFGLPSDAVIESLSFYFINADGSIVVMDDENGGAEFFVPQSEQ